VFERFTDRARRVVVLAQEEARMLNHNYIGTEHILLGLIHEGEGVAARAMEALGISLEQVRKDIEELIGQGSSSAPSHIPFTPRAKKVLELALREALQLGHNYIGTEHILLGLVREGEGVGAQVLRNRGASLDAVRVEVVSLLTGYQEEAGAGAERAPEGALHDEPLCPRCRGRLTETATYRVLDVAAVEGEPRSFTFAFCRACGTWLGTVA
jgi:ATP-dependent Clp protease ATP-binding subunit ClpC